MKKKKKTVNKKKNRVILVIKSVRKGVHVGN